MGFLDVIWQGLGPHLGEIRLIKAGVVRQQFVQLPSQGEQLALSASEEGWDAYYGVLPRVRRGGTADDCVTSTDVLWVDVDAKHFPTKFSTMLALAGFPLTPQIVVDSGHGYHAYWLLSQAIPFGDARKIMKGLAASVGGDHVYDAPRVLRVPGTTNFKGAPEAVRLIRMDDERRYPHQDLYQYQEPLEEERLPLVVTEKRDLDDLPPWLLELIEGGAPQGSRSEACFKACVWLLRYGYDERDIEDIFAATPDGIGAKYHERRDGSRWLRVTLEAARQAA